MVDINSWLDIFLKGLEDNFKEKVWFVGLQGSYSRQEATESSDIDVVVIFDELNFSMLEKYNQFLDTLSHRELICGFVSGKNEILNWEPSDLFQFYHDTKPIKGNLNELVSLIDVNVVNRAIKIGACNIYHGCVHNILFDKNDDVLRGLYKSASFVVQAIYFKQNGIYVSHLKDLIDLVNLNEKVILDTFIQLKNGKEVDFNGMSTILLDWSKEWIEKA